MLKLEFVGNTPDDLTAQIKEYVKGLKGTRGGKNDDTDAGATGQTAPQPLMPPGQQQPAFNPGQGFAAPGPGAAPMGAGFPAAAVGPSPEVAALVARINPRIDGAIASGQNPEQARIWLAGECVKAGVAEAATATLQQIKDMLLAKCPVPVLQHIAGLMNA